MQKSTAFFVLVRHVSPGRKVPIHDTHHGNPVEFDPPRRFLHSIGSLLQRLRKELVEALKGSHADYATYLEGADGSPYEDISAVLDLLAEDGKVFAVLDGFDKALANGRLTRNLWDQMRELAGKPSLRLVVASRRTLRELKHTLSYEIGSTRFGRTALPVAAICSAW